MPRLASFAGQRAKNRKRSLSGWMIQILTFPCRTRRIEFDTIKRIFLGKLRVGVISLAKR